MGSSIKDEKNLINSLSRIDVKSKNLSFPFYYKKVSKEMGNYFFRIIKGDLYQKIHLNKKVNLIMDLGANFGSASICFALRYPEANIISIEPVLETYQILNLNTQPFKQIYCYNFAASDETKTQKIYIDNEKMGRSSLIENHLNYEFTKNEEVKSINFKKFLEDNNIDQIDILKIDIEGYEKNVLFSIKEFIDNILIIYIEMHGEKNIKQLRSLLSATHDEKYASMHNSNLFEAIYIKSQI